MTVLWIVLGCVVAFVWVASVFDLLRRHLGARATAGWLILVLLLPIVGAVVYWALRKPSRAELEYRAEHPGRDLPHETPQGLDRGRMP